MSDITVVVTTVGPPRRDMLRRALESVYAQELQPAAIVVAQDYDHAGAAVTRQRGTECVCTPYVAYLDDDDEFGPAHLRELREVAEAEHADLVFPWFTVVGGTDPFPQHFGLPWSDAEPRQIPVTFLARVGAIRDVGGWYPPREGQTDELGNRAGEDYELTLRLVGSGARIVHHPVRTWTWHHWGGNSSGLPSRVDWKVN